MLPRPWGRIDEVKRTPYHSTITYKTYNVRCSLSLVSPPPGELQSEFRLLRRDGVNKLLVLGLTLFFWIPTLTTAP
jgi:hypothetical protein